MENQDDACDSDLVKEVLSGKEESFSMIVEKYEDKLLRYVNYMLKDYDSACDVVQDTFIKSYINLNSFQLERKFSSWLYRIAHNEAMNHIKRNKKTIYTNQEIDFFSNEDYPIDVSARIDDDLLKASVKKCMAELDVKYREVLLLSYFENLKYAEISDILRIPVSTVGIRIKRAKDKMKKICKETQEIYDEN